MFQIFNDPDSTPIPDTTVEALENRTIAQYNSVTADAPNPRRPGYGTNGRPVILNSNHLGLTMRSSNLFLYRWQIRKLKGSSGATPPDSLKTHRILRQFLHETLPEFKVFVATADRSPIVSCLKLPLKSEYWMVYMDQSPAEPCPGRELYHLTFVECKDLQLFPWTPSALCLTGQDNPQICNAIKTILSHNFRKVPSVTGVDHSGSIFLRPPRDEAWVSRQGLEVLYRLSFQPNVIHGRALVKVQTKCFAAYRAGPLQNLIRQYQESRCYNTRSLEALLEGLLIQFPRLPLRRRITGLASCTNSSTEVNPPRVKCYGAGPYDVQIYVQAEPAIEDGKYMTIADIFQEVSSGCSELNPTFPVINVGSRNKPVYWPVELCRVEPGQLARAITTPRDVADNTRSSIQKTLQVLARDGSLKSRLVSGEVVKSLWTHLSNLKPVQATFGIELSFEPITVRGRFLSAPELIYPSNSVSPVGGLWSFRTNSRLQLPAENKKWAWIWIDDDTEQMEKLAWVKRRMRDLAVAFEKAGVMTEAAVAGVLVSHRATNTGARIDMALSTLLEKHHPSLVLFLLPAGCTELWGSIQQLCDVKHGTHSINIEWPRLQTAEQSHFPWAVLGANLKLGGRNHYLPRSKLSWLAHKKCMLVGLTTSCLRQNNSTSMLGFAAIVTSVDSTLSQWPSEFCVQPPGQQAVAGLNEMIASRIRYWSDRNGGELPRSIIIYRDNIPLRSFECVAQEELSRIRQGCDAVYPISLKRRGLPQITMVLLDQQDHTYFSPIVDADPDGTGFPPVGMVVDRGVTDPRVWDFYLLSHCPVTGGNQPTRYLVAWDEVFRSGATGGNTAGSLLQELTYKLSYLVGERTMAMNVCAPAYYAWVALSRVFSYPDISPSLDIQGRHLMRTHPSLQNTMFYI